MYNLEQNFPAPSCISVTLMATFEPFGYFIFKVKELEFLRDFYFLFCKQNLNIWLNIKWDDLEYAVKAQTSLAPLSWFCGSHITTAHEQQCWRFQSYSKTAIANEIDKQNW